MGDGNNPTRPGTLLVHRLYGIQTHSVLFLVLVLFDVFVTFADFNSDGINGILNVHNTLRAKIAKGIYVAKDNSKSPATNMQKMVWSDELQRSAQNFANSCPTGHSGTPGVGENIFWYWTTVNIKDLNQYGISASQGWEKEFQEYGWPYEKYDRNLYEGGISHATQMAWANSNQIGCGVTQCPDGSWKKITVVCQYKPPGNYFGQMIYDDGPTCSNCPKGTSCESSTGLCV